MKFEQHIMVDAENIQNSAVEILQHATDLSKGAIKQAMKKGAVWLTRKHSTNRVRRGDKGLTLGDEIHLYYDENILAQIPNSAQLIKDEGAFSIWYKPYGMLCQGSKWSDHCTINRWAENNMSPQRPAYIVHRLDRAATGLIIIAHQKKIAAAFTQLFFSRDIEKRYQAVVRGHFWQSISIDSDIDGKASVSHVSPLNYDEVLDQTLVQVNIETGRKHQIRRHLSEAGFPIVGDRLYGRQSDSDGNTEEVNLCLVSCYLSFNSPVDQSKKEYTLPEALRSTRELTQAISINGH